MLFLLIPVILGSLIYRLLFQKKWKNLKNKHVIITGGSSGIGRSLAKLAVKQGAHVTIVARNALRLHQTEMELKNDCIDKNQKISSLSVDVSDHELVKEKFAALEEKMGPVYMLGNCAGLAICGKVEDMSHADIKTLIDVNYLGTLYPIQATVKQMKKHKEGIILILSSQCGLMGIFGFGIYASTKFALRGLAESLEMELRPHNISVTLALPADTDTPGYKTENETKPPETKLISGTGGLFHPDEMAEKILKDTLKGNFFSSLGFESFLLTTLCVGMAPFSTFAEVVLQSLILGPIRFISSFYVSSFQKIIRKSMEEENKNK